MLTNASPARGNQSRWSRLSETVSIARVRLVCGLIVAAFVLTHFSSHIAGIFLVDTMEYVRHIHVVWRTPVGQSALYAALATHVTLSLRTLFLRRTLRMPAAQWVQVGAGLAIPLLLIEHLSSVRLAKLLHNVDANYPQVLLTYWVDEPVLAIQMSALIVIIWTHACLGVHYWLRRYGWYHRRQTAIIAAALLFPSLVLAGFFASGNELAHRVQDEPGLADAIRAESGMTPEIADDIEDLRWRLSLAYLALVGAVLGGRSLRNYLAARHNPLLVEYADGRRIRALAGASILEVSRMNGVPHTSVCGGRGRCSTCRVEIMAAGAPLPPPGPQERQTLERVGVGPDIRLACQLRPSGWIKVRRLVHADEGSQQHPALTGLDRGREMRLVVLIVDLRASSRLAEVKLPYDVLYVINRFLNAVLNAVRAHGGHVVSTGGDGAVAIFGFDKSPEEAAEAALAASVAIWDAVSRINEELADDLPWPLVFGVGMDAGNCIVGTSTAGAGSPVQFVGNPGNVAARLEEHSKALGAPVVVSENLASWAGMECDKALLHTLELRGRSDSVRAYAFKTRDTLTAALTASTAAKVSSRIV